MLFQIQIHRPDINRSIPCLYWQHIPLHKVKISFHIFILLVTTSMNVSDTSIIVSSSKILSNTSLFDHEPVIFLKTAKLDISFMDQRE